MDDPTYAQNLTIQALAPDETTSTSIAPYMSSVDAILVTYRSDLGPFSDTLAQYVIHAGGSYVGQGAPCPDAWHSA